MTDGRKLLCKSLSILFIYMSLFSMTVNVKADKSGIGFYVKANVSDNQFDKGKTYFDLRMKPGQEDHISIIVGNSGSEAIKVSIAVNSAYTNSAGGVEYQPSDEKDLSMKYLIEDIVTPQSQEISVEAGTESTVVLTLNMPEKEYNGQILGGIVITKLDDSEKAVQEENSIKNIYSYVIGLNLTETDTELVPDLHFIDVMPELVNYRTSVVHYIQNRAAVLMKDAYINIAVFQKGSDEPLWTKEQSGIKMAPSSTMNYIFYLEDVVIVAGEYFSTVQIKWEDMEWNFRQEFTIEAEKANDINNESLSLSAERISTIPNWLLLLLAGILLIIFILLVVVAIKIFIKNKETQEK